MTQTNLALGETLKRDGMKKAADRRALLLSIARFSAKQHVSQHGTCTADDATQYFTAEMHTGLGNAAGSIFKGGEWTHTGSWVKSARVSNHARMNRVWTLVNSGDN